MYLKLTNGAPEVYSISQFRRDNKNIAFAKQIPDELLASYDVYPFTRPTPPEYDDTTHRLVNGAFTQDANGDWSLPYVIEALTADVALARRTAKMQSICREKILEVADELTQMNLSASYSTNRMSQEDEATYIAGLGWKDAMIAHCRALVADPNLAENWPTPSTEIVALAKKY